MPENGRYKICVVLSIVIGLFMCLQTYLINYNAFILQRKKAVTQKTEPYFNVQQKSSVNVYDLIRAFRGNDKKAEFVDKLLYQNPSESDKFNERSSINLGDIAKCNFTIKNISDGSNQGYVGPIAIVTEKRAIKYPTNAAPKFVSALADSTLIPKVKITPWRVLQVMGNSNSINDGCYRPPKDKTTWKMLTVVKSWVINRDNRMAIRNTWGAISRIKGIQSEVIFLTARCQTKTGDVFLGAENAKYGDILQVDVQEDTSEFTDRVLAGMSWVSTHMDPTVVYSSTDDNMLVELDALTKYVQTVINIQPKVGETCKIDQLFPFLCIYRLRKNAKPSRNSQSPWYVSESDYPPPILPNHCQGGFYTTTVSTVRLIVDVAKKTNKITMDAAWVTGILRQKLKMGESSVIAPPTITSAFPVVKYFEESIASFIRAHWVSYLSDMKERNLNFTIRNTRT